MAAMLEAEVSGLQPICSRYRQLETALAADDVPAARANIDLWIQTARALGPPTFAMLVQLSWVQRAEHNPGKARSSLETALRTSRRNGEREGIAYATLGLACLAADAGECDVAAELHGAAQAALDRTGLPGSTSKRAIASRACSTSAWLLAMSRSTVRTPREFS
jgi:hypothetical protein